jgi:hypothetical protein
VRANSPPTNVADFYFTPRWRKRSRAQLRQNPMCRFCAFEGRSTLAKVADHVRAHKGDWNEFATGELQSLCKDCHNKIKAVVERIGYRPGFDKYGVPLDSAHPGHPDHDVSFVDDVLLDHAHSRRKLVFEV